MSPELDTYCITKKVKEVLTDNNLGMKQGVVLFPVVLGCPRELPRSMMEAKMMFPPGT